MNAPNIEVVLIDSYSIAHGFDSVREAPFDHPESKKIAGELRELAAAEGATVNSKRDAKNEKLAKGDHYDLAFAEKIVEAALMSFVSAGGVIAFFKLAKELILQWLEISSRHQVKVKVGDISIEVSGKKDIDEVIKAAERLLKRAEPPVQGPAARSSRARKEKRPTK